jgi:Plasmid pRiA4b ORF-3-like protein
MPHTLYELDVRLREIEPPIWRAIEISGASTLEEVHYAIQVAMGWTNSHLHQFTIGDKHYGMADADGGGDLELEDECQVRLEDLVSNDGSFLYEYDFGDSWEHEVKVVKVTKVAKAPRPRCTAGARACPPEDCGGYGGYGDLLRALADPEHDDHEDSVLWAGDFQPERFEVGRTGRDLHREMEQLRELATDDDELGTGFDLEDDELADLPASLVKEVLALEPLQRGALAAVIAGSLAHELTEVLAVAGRSTPRGQGGAAPTGRRRRS